MAFIGVVLVLFPILQPNQTPKLFTLEYRDILSKIPKFYVVQSGSMEPAIKTGSLVLSLPSPTYANGDIVTFRGSGNKLITHRIGARLFPEGINAEPVYLTSGDANDGFDKLKLNNEKIVGKVIFFVPYLGYFADFAKEPYGFILFVIVPATILVYEELKFLLSKTARLFYGFIVRIKKKRVTQINTSINKGFPKAVAIIPIFGVLLVFSGLASSYFSDNETSSGNVFQASDQFGPPIAQTLVINEFLWDSSCSPNPETKFWLELYNGFDFEVNIKDWRFTDGASPANVIQVSNANFFIQPGEYILITKSNSTFSQSCYENPSNAEVLNLGGNPDFTPSTTNGVIKLERPENEVFVVVDRIEYGPGIIDTETDESIARNPNAVDSALGDTFIVNDFDVQENPTPGSPTP